MHRRLLLICVLFVLLAAACSRKSDKSIEQTSPPPTAGEGETVLRPTSEQKPPLQPSEEAILSPTSFRYGYDGQFGSYGIADTAKAYAGDILIGEAKASRIIESSPGPNLIEIVVVHYSISGQPVYRGIAHIQFGFGGGTLVYEKAVSGPKSRSIFVSWPSGD